MDDTQKNSFLSSLPEITVITSHELSPLVVGEENFSQVVNWYAQAQGLIDNPNKDCDCAQNID